MDWQQIVDYLSGLASEEERKALESWLAASAENVQQFNKVKRIWETSAEADSSFQPDAEQVWAKLSPVLDVAPELTVHKTPAAMPRTSIWMYTSVAAAVALLIAIGFLLPAFLSDTKTVITEAGETQEVLLADGTKVWLNERSEFTFPTSFSNTERQVSLKGEAFFDVAKMPDKPFRINTPSSQTTVLGTSFELSDRASKASAEIFVVTGKVLFGDSLNTVTLLPGKKASLQKNTQQLTSSENLDKNFMAWKTRQLIFDQIPFEEVLVVMEEYFDVAFKVSNPAILACRFTGNYRNPQLEELLEIFELGADLNITKQNETYTVSGEGCQTENAL